MGWFWAGSGTASASLASSSPCLTTAADRNGACSSSSSSSGCPMPRDTVGALTPHASRCGSSLRGAPAPTCSVPHANNGGSSLLDRLNPLNYMFTNLSQAPAPSQQRPLPKLREESSIPRGGPGPSGNWEYPSPQQMYNALLRKGYADTPVDAVEEMVGVHNFLNEGAWAEIVGWEARFAAGLAKGWSLCRYGEANATALMRRDGPALEEEPRLTRFQGRPGDMTPRAAMLQMLGRLYPSKFGTEPPFDRHDWFVTRKRGDKTTEVRYVIDYYSGQPEPSGEAVFYLDIRPAATSTGIAERMIRWGGDKWWKAIGAEMPDDKK